MLQFKNPMSLVLLFGLGALAYSAGIHTIARADATDSDAVQRTDAEIASIAISANTGEIEQNHVGVARAVCDEVRKFAQRLVDDHRTALEREQSLAAALNITPADNPIAQSLEEASQKLVTTLQTADAAGFDVVFLNSQIDVHRQALALVDGKLLPAVRSPELEQELISLRATVAAHLELAQSLSTDISHGDAGGQAAP